MSGLEFVNGDRLELNSIAGAGSGSSPLRERQFGAVWSRASANRQATRRDRSPFAGRQSRPNRMAPEGEAIHAGAIR